MASFTGVGDSVSLTVPEKGEDILVSISGTYSMVIELQLKVGEGAWKNLLTFNTENATEASYYTTKITARICALLLPPIRVERRCLP